MFIATALYDGAQMAAQTGVAGQLHGALLGLVTNAVAWGKGTVIGALVEPTFAGYARIAITWSALFVAPDGTYRAASQDCVFQPTDDLTPTAVTGYFVVASDGTTLLGGENFQAPINLPNHLSRLAETIEWVFTNQFQAEADLVN